MRKNVREVAASDLMSDEDASMDEFFDATGHWADTLQTWDMPENALEQQQFLSICKRAWTNYPPS